MTQANRVKLKIPKRPMSSEALKRLASRKFYQLILRWHFFCGILFIPLILVISVSGAIYLFEDEYEDLTMPELMFVTPGQTTLPASVLLENAKKALPDMKPAMVKINEEGHRSTQVIFTSMGRGSRPAVDPEHAHHMKQKSAEKEDISMEWADDGAERISMVMNRKKISVFLNPYTGVVLGTLDNDDRLMGFMKDLHGNLLAGKFGTKFVELTSCWLIALMITGLIIWWPRGKMGVRGTLIPRLNESKRVFWRDLHAVPAFYFSFFIIFLVISGLPWTDIWGSAFKEVQSGLNMTAPAGFRSRAIKSTFVENGTLVSVDHVIAEAYKNNIDGGLNIKIPRNEMDTFALQKASDDPSETTSIHVDQYSGEVLAVSDWSKVPLLAKAVPYGIKLHRGEYFGIWNLVLALITTLVLILMAVTGMVMWLQRRPKGKLGEYKAPKEYRKPKWVIVTTIALCIFMPILGASLILFIISDFIYGKIRSYQNKRSMQLDLNSTPS